jgi:hypothetical protein
MLAAVLGLVVGVVIGALGGGGGVLTVPALVYLLGQSAHDATTGSVIIVGVTAAVGALARLRGRGVDWRYGIAFGVIGIPSAYLGTLLNHSVRQPVVLLAFAALTTLAAAAMLMNPRTGDGGGSDPCDRPGGSGGRTASMPVALGAAPGIRVRQFATVLAEVVLCGGAVGFLTGFLGVGGGFLVVPALVIVMRMPMTLAIGTSLLIIALNSISSLASRVGALQLDWHVIAPFTLVAVAGALIGKRVADSLSGATLTRSFAVMLLVVGIFVGFQSVSAL